MTGGTLRRDTWEKAPRSSPAKGTEISRHFSALPITRALAVGLEGGEGVFHGGDEGVDVGVGVGGRDEVDLKGGGFDVDAAG